MRKTSIFIVAVLVLCLPQGESRAQKPPLGLPAIPGGGSPDDSSSDTSEGDQGLRDAIDARAPEDRRASTMLKRTRRNIDSDDWAAAIQQLQSILNEPGDALVRVGPGQYVSMRAEANRLLREMPRVWRERYVRQFGAVAERTLADALKVGNYAAVGDVATRYLHTDAGRRAARALVLRHLDRGEYAMALRWFEMLRVAGHEPSTPLDQLQYAMARKLAGLPVGELPEMLVIGQQTVQSAGLLDELKTSWAQKRPLSDWRQFLGDASRTAIVDDSMPLLVGSWQAPLLPGSNTIDAVHDLVRDVLDAQQGLVPAGVPIVVGTRVACRTSDGVSVFDVNSGQPLWRTQTEESTADLFRQASRMRSRSAQVTGPSARAGSQDIFQSFLFRDAVHGLLSSDGQRLYVIEKHSLPNAALQNARFQNARSAALLREYATNELAAYNVVTGFREWSIGGPEVADAFLRPPFAGQYFHGVPVAVEGNLYVVTEKDNEIRLHALDPATGESQWSQLLAYSDTRIANDPVRRTWSAQITVSSGMLICPTTADWLVAVDPLTRSILWAHRYRDPGTLPVGANRQNRAPAPLSSQWPAAAPMIVGDRVVYSPAEFDVLEALELSTGRRAWSVRKTGMRYLAGVTSDSVIAVSLDRVVALRASDGKLLWSGKFAPEDMGPAGRGLMSAQYLHQPVASGGVVTFDLADGHVVHRSGAVRTEKLVGNLVMHAGGTLMQTPTHLEAWEKRPDSDAGPPTTPLDRLRAAEIQYADGEYESVIALLDSVDPQQLSEAARERHRRTLIAALQRRFEDDPAQRAAELERLAELLQDDFRVARLRVRQQLASGNATAAFRQLTRLYASRPQKQVEVDDTLTVDADAWIGGQLADTWAMLDATSRDALADVVAEAAAAGEPARFLQVFAFHPTGIELTQAAVAAHLDAARYAEAEQATRRMWRFDPESAAALTWDCAVALQQAGQTVDARSLLAEFRLAHRIPELPVAPVSAAADAPAWAEMNWSVRRFNSGTPVARLNEFPAYRSDIQFHRDHVCYQAALDHQRLHIFRLATNKIVWSLPLSQGSSLRSLLPNGRSMLVLNGRSVTCLDPLGRRVLWEQQTALGTLRQDRVFQPLKRSGSVDRVLMTTGQEAPLAVVNEDYVCLRGTRSIEVRDAVTGGLRWSHRIRPTDTVRGTTEAVFVESTSAPRKLALRAADGRTLEIGFPPSSRTFSAIGRGLVVIEEGGFLRRTVRVRLHDPVADTDLWSLRLPLTTSLALTDLRELVAVTSPETASVVNLVTGEVSALNADEPFGEGQLFVASRPDLLLIASSGNSASYFRTTQQAIDGKLTAFSRVTRKSAWSRSVSDGSVLTNHFRTLPVLVITENERQQQPGKVWDVRVLDPATGKVLASQRTASRIDYGQQVRFDAVDRFVEVVIYNQRLRFAATPPAGPEPVSP